MCGIAGIIGQTSGEPRAEALGRMLQVMSHRGPDDEGLWLDPDDLCGLGHKRLSIIDLAGGHQPMANEDESMWISFNGCIYNYEDLRRELRQGGHQFRTDSDTEVILHAYEQWGADCVTRFNGMWALAIWDRRKRELFCSRDRVGIKPFYYTWDGRSFTFASEIKALLAAGAVKAKADPEALRQYVVFQFCLNDHTLFEGVHRLPPGHNLLLRPGEPPAVSQYWDIQFDIDEAHDEAYFVDRLGHLLEDAVRLRLRADVQLGAHLSGGLDSATIVSLMRLLLGDAAEIQTFTGAFGEGPQFDETAHAQTVSEAAGTQYNEIRPTSRDFVESIEKIAWLMDEPAAGPGVFPQYWVSKLAAEKVKVVLGGQGGDELFIGYARYLAAYLEECIKGAVEDNAGQAEYVATLTTIVPSLPSLQQYVPLLRSFWRERLFDEPAERYFRLVDRFVDSRQLIAPDVRSGLGETFERFRAIFDSHGAAAMINRIFNFDLKGHLQSLLHVEDRTSMAWGLESRVPLVDHRLVELMASIPPTVKFKNGRLKHLFRRSVQHLVPEPILARNDKMGFPVPLNGWFKSELRDFMGDMLLSGSCLQRGLFDADHLRKAFDNGAGTFDRSLWGVLSLELWHRAFIDTPAKTGN